MVERVNKIISSLIIMLLFCGVLGCIETKKSVDDTEYVNSSEFESNYTNSIGMKFMKIPAGEFMMGSTSDEDKRDDDEGPVHKVTIKEPFYLGKFEVTQEQWREVMGNDPSSLNCKGDNLPVDSVYWSDAQEFIKKLNEKEGTDKYRLPSEAEWEYACRAGTTTPYCCGDYLWVESFDDDLGDNVVIHTYYGWYAANSDGRTIPVGQMKPNPWDLYDMHGNVWEWVQDKYHSNYNGAPSGGSAWENGNSSGHVARGGGCRDRTWDCRSANRGGEDFDWRPEYSGFRVLREI